MRLVLMLMFVTTPCFNPRICKRCDKKWAEAYAHVRVSIHASVKDATKRQKRAIAAQKVSIHASVKDATSASSFNPMAYLFQSTHL